MTSSSTKEPYNWAALLVLVLGSIDLLGWWIDHEMLIRFIPQVHDMTFNTALCFIVASAAMLFSKQRIQWIWGSLLLGASLLVFFQDFNGFSLGLDNLFFDSHPYYEERVHPGRMAPTTSLSFILTGVFLILMSLPYSAGFFPVHQGVIVLIGFLGATGSVMRFLFEKSPESIIHFASMSLPTALGFVLITVAAHQYSLRKEPEPEQRTLFFPGMFLMGFMEYRQKFFFISVLFFIPLSILMVQSIFEVNDKVRAIEQRELGLTYFQHLIHIFERVPRHRGQLNAYLNGDSEFKSQIIETHAEIEHHISLLEALHNHAATLKVKEEWSNIKKDWNALSLVAMKSSPEYSWQQHTQLISKIISHIGHVGYNSQLLKNPEWADLYLITGLLNNLPNLLENIGQARGLGSGMLAKHELNSKEHSNLTLISSRINFLLGELNKVFEYSHMNSVVATELQSISQQHNDEIQTFLKLLGQEVLSVQNASVQKTTLQTLITASDFFALGTQTLNHGFSLFYNTLDKSNKLLSTQRQKFIAQEYFLIFTAFLSLLFIAYFFHGFYLSVVHTVSVLRHNSECLIRGETDKIKSLKNNDELGEITEAFNQISHSFLKTTDQLKSTEKELKEALNLAEMGYWRLEIPTYKLYWSDKIYSIYEINPEDNAPSYESFINAVHPDDREHINEVYANSLNTKIAYEIEHRLLMPDGRIKFVRAKCYSLFDDSGIPVRSFGTMQDMTEEVERRHKEEYAQRLESLGTLAGGVAHDFNNLLAIIMGNTELSILKTPEHSPAQKFLDNVVNASQRAGDLCDQMLAYAGEGKYEISFIDLSQLVHVNMSLIEATISKKISLELELTSDISWIEGDPAQIQQILMNLVLNASEAMGEHEGTLSIQTKNYTLQHREIVSSQFPHEIAAGDFVLLEVSDTGCGMDESTLEKIYEPFFTTKFTGRGLGMSAVSGILREHHGGLRIETRENSGSTFQIFLPVVEREEIKKEAEQSTVTESYETQESISKLILVVDDEHELNESVCIALKGRNWNTLSAYDGQEAVGIFEAHKNEIQIILLDVSLPKMGGVEVYDLISKEHPELRILFSSGYSKDAISDDIGTKTNVDFIHKPYRMEELFKKLDSMMSNS